MFRDGINDELWSDDLFLVGRDNITEHLLGKIKINFTFFQVCICNNFVLCAFQFTDI